METNSRLRTKELVPFLKWAGGKRWLANTYRSLFPVGFDRYIEPFVGSGAVFFSLQPDAAILSDANPDLIETYISIRNNWRVVYRHLRTHQSNHSSDYYYAVRCSVPKSPFARAARFIYLNRTCWNGLYRVNRLGEFNVPIGTKTSVLLESDDFETTADRLNQASINCADFEQTINEAEKGDFVFIDPPYTVAHNVNGFIKYNQRLFTWEDQVRLKTAIVRATRRGAKCLLLNAYHESLITLYSDVGEQIVLDRPSVLAADSRRRRQVEELAVKCW